MIEVILNAITDELERATDVSKLELEKEIIEFVDLHGSIEKDACLSQQSAGIRKGNLRSGANELHKTDPGHSKVTHRQFPFLATSSLHQILQMTLKLYSTGGCNTNAASQTHSQLTSSKTFKCCSKLISFVLNASLRHLTLYAVMGKENPLKTFIYGDIKMLGLPLLRLICLLKSGLRSMICQSKKETKGKKDVEEQRELLHLALVCLKELIMMHLQSPELTVFLEDMVSDVTLENATFDNEGQTASRIDDQATRSKELFIVKTLKPLFFELLELSFSGEVEVDNSFTSYTCSNLCVFTNLCSFSS